MRKVAILGGGMAGLTAAWELSAPELRDGYEVTVHQRGWRLGGKGASSRGPHGRIEEHGLHVWLGIYDNAFRLMRETYEQLERERTDPGCPIASWRDAFIPADRIGVEERFGQDWSHWVATFAANDLTPGIDPGGAVPGRPLAMLSFLERGVRLLADFSRSIRPAVAPAPAAVVLSGSPEPPNPRTSPSLGEIAALLRQAEIAATVGAVESLRLMQALLPHRVAVVGDLLGRLDRIRDELVTSLESSADSRRLWQFADLLIACMQGALRDGLFMGAADFSRIDHLDFREWLSRNGALAETVDSPLVRGLHDLVFAYEAGDRDRPRFAAGLGLFLSTKLFFDYKGAIFWKLAAGMGDVVFAPLYEALRARGVRFEFFHRVDALHLDAEGRAIGAISIGRQARLADDRDHAEYEPLVRVRGLPCFPSVPRREQLAGDVAPDLECAWADRADEQPLRLVAGRDFDDVILATSIGMVPLVCGELLEHDARWREMVNCVKTVPTAALQLWLRPDESQLGWAHEGAMVSGYTAPFETYASMTHTLPFEEWSEPEDEMPRAVAYFCSVLAKDDGLQPAVAHARVRADAQSFLEHAAAHYWPAAATDGAFSWELLAGGDLDAQYWRANIDPSDEYVQSLPGSGRSRLRADASGFDNLFLAGDWIDCGLNAGCVEAATIAGIQAANAVRRRPLMDGVLGLWCGFETPAGER